MEDIADSESEDRGMRCFCFLNSAMCSAMECLICIDSQPLVWKEVFLGFKTKKIVFELSYSVKPHQTTFVLSKEDAALNLASYL